MPGVACRRSTCRCGKPDRPMTTYDTRSAALAGAAGIPLAAAKLAPPRPRAGLVERPRLARALDAADNDPVRLWTYVAAAIDGIRPDLGRRALRRLGADPGLIEGAIDELMD